MTRLEVVTRIRHYIAQNFLYTRPDYVLGEDEPLFDRRIVDSLGILELIGFLASSFGVIVEDSDITDENLGTLGAIADFVCGKLELSARL